MPNQLSLKARYRNAKDERVPFNRMSPALQCMAIIEGYRDRREVSRDGDDWAKQVAEIYMEHCDREFASAHEELRSAIRFNNAMETA